MLNEMKVALIVADPAEYEPCEKRCLALGAKLGTELGNKTATLTKILDDKKLTLSVMLCGIGKVNAAAAAGYFAANGYKIAVSTGFSGGLSDEQGVAAVLGTEYLEHDFDLVCLFLNFLLSFSCDGTLNLLSGAGVKTIGIPSFPIDIFLTTTLDYFLSNRTATGGSSFATCHRITLLYF